MSEDGRGLCGREKSLVALSSRASSIQMSELGGIEGRDKRERERKALREAVMCDIAEREKVKDNRGKVK